MKTLLREQTSEFLASPDREYFISSDGTTTNKEKTSLLGVGVIDQNMQFHCLELKSVVGKDAESGCIDIAGSLPSAVIHKCKGFISDTAAVQLKTQRLLNEHFKEIRNDQTDLPSIRCNMHTGNRAFKYRNRFLNILFLGHNGATFHHSQMPKDVRKLLDDVVPTLGLRQTDGFKRNSLKQPLDDLLKLENAKQQAVGFVNRLGSRSGYYRDNALALIQYRPYVVRVLRPAIEKAADKHTKFGEKQHQLFQEMLKKLTTEWDRIHLVLGTAIMLESYLVNSVFKVENTKLTVKEKKEVVKDIYDSYNTILGDSTYGESVFERLRSMGIKKDCTLNGAQTLAVRETESKYLAANEALKAEIDLYISAGSKKALAKYEKDFQPLLDQPDSDRKIPTSNRPMEGCFAVYKRNEKTFDAMSNHMIETLTRASVNKLGDWFASKSPEEQQQLLKKAKDAQPQEKAIVKQQDLAIRRKRSRRNSE